MMTRIPSRRVLALAAIASLPVALACGGGSGAAAKAVMPKQASTPDAIECDTHAHYAEPLIVDLDPSQRGEIEQSMAHGIVVVSYDCKHLKILPDCHLDGSYEFQGMSIKQNVIHIDNADDLQANLPSFVPSVAAKLEASFSNGQELDVALVLIGAKRTTVGAATPKDLLPNKEVCAGATHFVRGAQLGAFTRTTAQKGQVSTVAQVFGAGASGSSTAAESMSDSDGQLSDCQSSSPDAEKPPNQCRSPIRLQLMALAPEGSGEDAPDKSAGGDRDKDAPPPAEVPSCARGFVPTSDGVCRRATEAASQPHACDPQDPRDCAQQCNRGDGASCMRLVHLLLRAHDTDGALAATKKACDVGEADACYFLGRLSGMRDKAQAIPLYRHACDLGSAKGCFEVGNAEWLGEGTGKDLRAAVHDLTRGCAGGDPHACVNVAVLLVAGNGVPHDFALAARLFKRACDGGRQGATGCNGYAAALELGQGVPADLAQAKGFYERGCQLHSIWACLGLASMYETGVKLPDGSSLVAADPAQAQQIYGRARDIAAGGQDKLQALAWAILDADFGAKHDVDGDMAARLVDQMEEVCAGGAARDCAYIGILSLARNDRRKASAYFRKACDAHDRWACWEAQRLHL